MTLHKHTLGESPVTYTDLNGNNEFGLVASLNFALDGAVVTNQDNLRVDLFTSDNATTKTNAYYDEALDTYTPILEDDVDFDATFDNHDDTSVDPLKWDTASSGNLSGCGGSVTETGTVMRINTSGSGNDNGSHVTTAITVDEIFDVMSSYIRISIDAVTLSSSSQGSAGMKISLYDDGSNDVAMLTADADYLDIMQKDANTAMWRKSTDDGANWSDWTAIDTTGWSVVKLKYQTSGSSGGTYSLQATVDIDWEKYRNTPFDMTVEHEPTDSTTTTGTAIVKTLNEVQGNTKVTSLSFDGGSNYLTLVEKTLQETANTGTDFSMKFVATIDPTTNASFVEYSGYAYYYGD